MIVPYKVPAGTVIPSTKWKLAEDLYVDFHATEDGAVVALTQKIDEYGDGKTREKALYDLLLTLVDLRDSLERRVKYGKVILSDELNRDLVYLKRLFVLHDWGAVSTEYDGG